MKKLLASFILGLGLLTMGNLSMAQAPAATEPRPLMLLHLHLQLPQPLPRLPQKPPPHRQPLRPRRPRSIPATPPGC